MERKRIYKLLAAAGIISILSFFGISFKDEVKPILSPRISDDQARSNWCADSVAQEDEVPDTLFVGCNGFF
jgi:hypothetical protein